GGSIHEHDPAAGDAQLDQARYSPSGHVLHGRGDAGARPGWGRRSGECACHTVEWRSGVRPLGGGGGVQGLAVAAARGPRGVREVSGVSISFQAGVRALNYAVRILLASLLGLMALAGTARAALTIEITQGVQGALPIAIVPFGWTGPAPNAPEDVSGIIAADLRRSGRFVPFPEQDMLSRPHSAAEVNFKDWRVLGQES